MSVSETIDELEREIREKKAQLNELYRSKAPEPVDDYQFVTHDGRQISIEEMFGHHDDLILVHNMGRDCPYCTMWADGFNGLVSHIEDRAAFAVCSPDGPEVQRRFATARAWSFEMVSPVDGTFIEDMGFVDGDRYLPGMSTFYRDDETIYRVARRRFGPHDEFCAAWNMFEVLRDGVDGWAPRFWYDEEGTQATQFSPNIALDVTDREGAVRLLREVLGMSVIDTDDTETVVQSGHHRFYIQEEQQPMVYLEFEVEDLISVSDKLREIGCELEETTIPEGDVSYMVRDPFGMRYHLFERPGE